MKSKKEILSEIEALQNRAMKFRLDSVKQNYTDDEKRQEEIKEERVLARIKALWWVLNKEK